MYLSFRALPLTECRQAVCPCASSSLGLPILKCRRELLTLCKSLLPATMKHSVMDGRFLLPCSFVGPSRACLTVRFLRYESNCDWEWSSWTHKEQKDFKVHRYHRLPPQNCVVWILTACQIQNCFHLLTLADQSVESGPAFSMQRGFTLRLRESHCLDFWSDKGCLTHMSLMVLTECCRSMSRPLCPTPAQRQEYRREVWESLQHCWSCSWVWVQGRGRKNACGPSCAEEYVPFPWLLHRKMDPGVHQMSQIYSHPPPTQVLTVLIFLYFVWLIPGDEHHDFVLNFKMT